METKTLMDSYLNKHQPVRVLNPNFRTKQQFFSVSQPLKKPYKSPVSQSIGSIGEIPPIIGQTQFMMPRKDLNLEKAVEKQLPSIQKSPLRQMPEAAKEQKMLSYYEFKTDDLAFSPELYNRKAGRQLRTFKNLAGAQTQVRTPSTQTRQHSQTNFHTESSKSPLMARKISERGSLFDKTYHTTTKDMPPLIQDDLKGSTQLFPEEQRANTDMNTKKKQPDPIEEKLKKDPVLIRDRTQLFEIHCIDEERKMKYDFYCDRKVLSTHIHYFDKQKHMKPEELDDLDISIYCEVKIFSWLMKYVRWLEYNLHRQELDPVLLRKRLKPPNKPEITRQKCLSLLVSSHFLTIPSLIDESAKFVKDHLDFLLRHRFQFDLISKEIIRKLAKLLTVPELFKLEDPKRQLKHRLFEQKLELILTDREFQPFYRCVYCNRLFTLKQREWMACDKANIFIDFHGNVIAQHVADRDFDMHSFLMWLKDKQKWSWDQIFWNIYSLLVQFECSICSRKFIASEINSCACHPEKPQFNYGSNVGRYPCCGEQAIRFSTDGRLHGCESRLHEIKTNELNQKEAQIIRSIYPLICDESEKGAKLSKSNVHQAIQQFMQSVKPLKQSQLEEDQDEADKIQHEYEDSGDDEDIKKARKYLGDFQPQALERMEQQRRAGYSTGEKPSFQNDRHKWRTDCIRQDDKLKMDELMKKLSKCRCKEAKLPIQVPSYGHIGIITRAGPVIPGTRNSYNFKKGVRTAAPIQRSKYASK